MESFAQQFWQETWVPLPVIVGRLVLAAVLGALVGLEREWRRRPAGLRTHILICLSTTAIAILAIEITHIDAFGGQEIRIDPLASPFWPLASSSSPGVTFMGSRPGRACGSPEPWVSLSVLVSGRSQSC
jgi:putative Mg2+ transporter-C (MgtC) family protein